MATVTLAPSTADWAWDTDGTTFTVARQLQPSTADWTYGTSGQPSIIKTLAPSTADWAWNTQSNNDIVRKELLIGSGVTAQVWDRQHWNNAELGFLALIQYKDLKFEIELSGPGTFKIILGPEYLGAAWLAKDNIIKFVVEGVLRFSCYIEDFIETLIDEDETPGIEVVGRGIGKCLEWGSIAPSGWPSADYSTTRTWLLSTRGAILDELLDEITGRGTITQVNKDGWDGIRGSNGALWDDLLDLELKAGGSYASLLEDWGDYGVEWLMGPGFNLQLANYIGQNLANSVVLYPLNDLRSQENTFIRRDIRTQIFVEDGNGSVAMVEDVGAVAQWDQRELYQVFSDAVGIGSATSSGYALLELIKDQLIERRVKIDPFTQGRRPFVDFNVGDTVSIVFAGVKVAFRVLAIALSVDENNMLTAEVTLDYVLEAQRRRRQKLLEGSGGGGGVGAGAQTVYALGGGFIVSPSTLGVLPLQLKAFTSTTGKVGFTLIGTASVAQVLTVNVIYSTTILETFQYTLPAGVNTVEVTWLWTVIPEGAVPMRLDVSVSTGTFIVADTKAQFWVEARGIAGRQATTPVMFVTEEVGVPAMPTIADVAGSLPVPTAQVVTVDESVPELDSLQTIEDVHAPTHRILSAWPTANADDGWTDGTTFTSTGSSTFAGKVAGVPRSAFYRFPITVDLTGRTIVDAWLVGTAHSTSAAPATVLYAIDDDAPMAPTSVAEYTSATLTSESRDWLAASTAGQLLTSPSIKNIVDELLASYGTVSSIVIMHQDDGSSASTNNEFRSREYGASSAVKLVIVYEGDV